MIEITDWARDILGRSHQAASRFDPGVTIRLGRTSQGVQAVLAERPEPQDRPVSMAGFTLYVEEGLSGLIDVEEPHDRLVLRPAGSTPNAREH